MPDPKTRSRVTRVVRDATAEDPDFDGRVEQDQVDAAFGRGECRFVFGVEMPWVAQLEDARPPAAHHADGPEVGRAAGPQLPQPPERRGGGLEHRADQVPAGPRQGEDVRDQQAVGELDAFLVRQRPGAFGIHLGRGRHQAGDQPGSLADERVEPERPGAPRGERVVESGRLRRRK